MKNYKIMNCCFLWLCAILCVNCYKSDGSGDDGPVDASGDTDTDADTDTDIDVDSDADTDTDIDVDSDADTDTDTDIDVDSDADTDTDTDFAVYPDCYERGGDCLDMNGPDFECPDGTYNPFSGSAKECYTGAPRLCCVPLGDPGAPCSSVSECDEGDCMAEYDSVPVDGMCWSGCMPDKDPLCDDGTLCVRLAVSAVWGYCMRHCTTDEWCREGWSCEAVPKPTFDLIPPDTNYVCWGGFPGGTQQAGLGETCKDDFDCLSMICREEIVGVSTCTAKCDDTNPCLLGTQCLPSDECNKPGCGYCF